MSSSRMQCHEVRGAIAWLLDDELEAAQATEIEAHLRECAACSAEVQGEGRLRLAVRRALSDTVASEALRERVGVAIRRERRRERVVHRAWPAVAAAAVLVSFIWQGATGGVEAADLDEAALRHARDLPMDVVAGDLGQVQQYFAGKLPFAVRVPELGRNVPVSLQLGGRVVNLKNRDAAYVRYDLPRGRVSVFVYPDLRDSESEVRPLYKLGAHRVLIRHVRGFNAAQWRSQGLVYSVVSDLPEGELSQVLSASFP